MASEVVRVDVETEPDGTVVVTWQIEGDPTGVDIAAGPSPDHLDHAHVCTAPAGVTSTRLAPSAPGRVFVSVAPQGSGPAVVAIDRRIGFDGAANFRDLGGYRTTSGGRTRWGMVFRADSLHRLTERDLARYGELGVRTVYDLRRETERSERPSPFESSWIPLIGRSGGAELPPITTGREGECFLYELYRGLLEHAARPIGQLLTGLASPGALPAVFHCHAGKDRTGMVAALLLEALGVPRDDVLDDYELTDRYRTRTHREETIARLRERGMGPEAAAGILSAPRWAMEAALRELDERHGGVEAFLRGPAGMTPAGLAELRARLVGPAGPPG